MNTTISFVQNYPFFSIFLAIFCAIICLPLRAQAAKRVTLACLTALMLLSAVLLIFTLRSGASFTYTMGHFPAPFGNEIRAGALEAFMALLFCSVCLLSIAGGLRDIFSDIPADRINHYFLMQNMLMGAMLAIIYTNDIFTAFVFIDIITIAACSIVLAKPGGKTLTAAMAYLIMSLIGSCLILLSIAMLYGVTGHLLFPGLRESVSAIAATGKYTMPLFVLVGMMIAGIAIKSALFPFHGWLPNVYTSATTATSAVLSGFITKCYLVLLIKLIFRVFGLETMELLRVPHIMLAFGAAGIVYGSWKATRQWDIKRMLSYASIAQVGYISVAISLNTAAGIAAACFHIVVHAVEKSMLFTAAGGLAAVSEGQNDYDFMRGAARLDPLSAAAFITGGLSTVGMPPLPGFASKLYVTLAALETPFAVPAILTIVVISTVLGSMYFFPAIACILSNRAAASGQAPREKSPLSFSYHATLIVFMAITLFFGFFSQQILRLIEQGLAVFG